METINKRKRREPRYQAAEKELLVDLVEENYAVVENKKTDAVRSRTKTERWKTMADQFNATSSVHFRDWLVLRTLWENMKKKAKIVIALQHDNLYATGNNVENNCIQDYVRSCTICIVYRWR